MLIKITIFDFKNSDVVNSDLIRNLNYTIFTIVTFTNSRTKSH